jgi:hypothetical protein
MTSLLHNPEVTNNWFTEARYGLYSLLGRAEWVWNREEIPLEEYKQLAARRVRLPSQARMASCEVGRPCQFKLQNKLKNQ